MNITKDDIIRTKFHAGFSRDNTPVKEITIHATGGGGTLGYVQSGGRAELYRQGIALFHYLIRVSGEVVEIIDPDNWVYHSSSGQHDKETIGIEIEKPSITNSGLPKVEQMSALLDLVGCLRSQYPSISIIATHDYNRKVYSNQPPKPCPGDFDWSTIKEKFPDLTYNGV